MIRIAIFCAVSTKAQSKDDKVSLSEQEKRCRAHGAAQGWVETAGPFIADGYSRSGYYDLSQAAKDIPALGAVLANLDKFDVLVMYSFDRLGDVLPMLAVYFKQKKRQLFSISQPAHLQDPKQYKSYMSEGSGIMMAGASIEQEFRISSLRRGWFSGVPARIDKGLHPLSLAFGYALAGEGQPAVQIPEKIALLRDMKDWTLAGVPFAEIGRRADKVMPPERGGKWVGHIILEMLVNPYYAGFVRFGGTRVIEKGKRVKPPPSEWKMEKGKHVPVWDEATYQALVAEVKRRREGKRNFDAKYPFSGLTYCWCGTKARKHGKPPYEYLGCDAHKERRGDGHFSMRYETALPIIVTELVKALREYEDTPPKGVDFTPLKARLEELKSLRTRIQEGFEIGLYNPEEATRKMTAIEEEGQAITRKITHAADEDRARVEWIERMGGLRDAAEQLPAYIREWDPRRVNQLLSSLIAKITLNGEDVEIVWRE